MINRHIYIMSTHNIYLSALSTTQSRLYVSACVFMQIIDFNEKRQQKRNPKAKRKYMIYSAKRKCHVVRRGSVGFLTHSSELSACANKLI